jgi:hypothetical protein
MKRLKKMVADGNDGNCQRYVRRFVEDDVHVDRQRGNEVLLRAAEERKTVLQTGKEGSRKMLL